MNSQPLARLVQAFLVMLAMTVIVFIGIHLIGNPVDILISPEADQMERDRMMSTFGMDKPLWTQYGIFLMNALQGDLGTSFVYNLPAIDVVLSRLPATLELALVALLLAVVIGIPLGLYCGLRPDSPVSRFIMAFSILGFSLPGFWMGLILIMVFAVELGWLPSTGRGDTVEFLGVQWSFLTWNGLSHMLLPAINLAMFKLSMVLRLTRAGVTETLSTDYIKFARARGLSPQRIVGVHVLKNIMIPLVTIIGMEFGSTVAFAIVTETVFAWPGIGKLIIDSINVLDRPVIVAYLMIVVSLFVLLNFLVDLTYYALDPRARRGGRA
ncbi:ABC transporter permease [Paracandidimonas soli]|uniref:Peptide/nickel transport system permease protein n=1 Tax=Paracandidimonas soli TaxID=1917182 RepID=A0A4R3V687_9BURK|nr:ABC transporter permease [Paracandidimonas soli]TCU98923.1 peptide/nickel transport system permease protein [Paracandidimonas soli]